MHLDVQVNQIDRLRIRYYVHNLRKAFVQPGITVPFDRTLRPETNYLVFDNLNNYGPIDIRVADNYTGNQPSQIHLSLAGPNSYWVMWATGQGRVSLTFTVTPIIMFLIYWVDAHQQAEITKTKVGSCWCCHTCVAIFANLQLSAGCRLAQVTSHQTTPTVWPPSYNTASAQTSSNSLPPAMQK